MTISRPIRKYNKNAQRRKQSPSPNAISMATQNTPLVPTLGAHSTVSITLTFTEQVSLKGIPNYSNGSITVNAATRPTPNTVALVFNNTLVSSVPLTIPFQDPAIRNNAGGYVQPGAYTFS